MSENFDEFGSRIDDHDAAENAAGNFAQSDGGQPAYSGSSQVVQPAAGEAIVLPAGASIAALEAQGRDLVIVLDNGDRIVVPDGAIYVPQIVVGDTVVPPINVAALLNDAAPQPAAGAPQSSGGNFYVDPGSIQAAYGLGDLLPYTELSFGEQPDDEEYQYIDRDADIVITTPDNPVGAVAVMGIVDEAGLPARGSEPAGTESATDSETITGTIVFDVPDGLGSITLNGVAITQVGQTFVTEYGVLTITSISGNVIGYSYTLTDNLLGQDVSDQFIAVVTDTDGDSATATLVIDVIDDHPIARSDTDTVAAGTYGPESGNVMTGEGTTSGAAGVDVEGADSASVTSVSNSDGETVSAGAAPMVIEGEYGTLTLYADGHYDYVRAAGTPGGVSDVFTYTLTDDDGSTASATLTINIADAPVVIISVPEVGDGTIVDEDGLPPRGDEPAGSEEVEDGDPDNNSDDGEETSGTITFSPGDGPAVVTIGDVIVTGPGQVITLPEGTLTIVNYDPVAGEIDYTFTLTDNTSGDDTSVTFTVTVTDVDGDTDSADVTIHIIDDEPEAVDDFGSQASENASVTVDAFANDTPGADGVAFDDIEYVEDSLSGTGTVTYNGDGTFTYTPGPGEQGTVTFDYSITDGDGDVSTATVTIRLLDDSTPTLSIEGDNTVDEAGLPARDGEPAGSGEGADGNPTNNSDTSEFAEGTITTDTGGDTIRSLVINDVDVTGGGTVTTSKGVLTVTDNGDGTYGYAYRLTDNTLSDPDSDTFTVRLTDSDNDSVTSTLVIGIADDTPEAFSDPDIFVTEGATDPVGGDLLDDDTQGADGAKVTSVTIGGVDYDIAESGTTTISNANGTYQFTAAGTWSFLPSDGLDQSDGAVDASFTYEITDGDEDTSSADQGIYITDGEGPEAGPDIALQVDDENLADGSDPAVPVTSADDIVFTPGSDPIASVVFGDVGDLGGGLDWVRVDDDTITGSDGGRLVITLQLGTTTNADGTVTATVTATLNDEYNDHPVVDADDLADLGTVDVIASDGETGAAADSVTATVSVTISDDLPTITAEAPAANALTVDESDFATDATADFSGLFTPDYNADNPGTVSGYTLGIAAGPTGLVDTLTDENVVLVMNGATVEGRTEGSNLLVFVVSVDTDGIVTLDQRRAVEHGDPTDDNDPAHLASSDLITLSATATDSDGDTDTATVGIGNAFTFLDDGPSLTDVGVGSSVMLDETDAGSPGGFPITAVSAAPILSFGSDYGADDGGTTTFEIAVVGGGASGLSTAQGDYPITLVQTSPTLITGTYNGGLTAFTIQINADGTLTLTQQVPLEHTDPTDDNDVLDLAGLIDATVTVTDDDGDSVSDTVAIGGAISFYDDGPWIDANVDDAGNAVTLTTYDEQTIGAATDTDMSSADFSGAFTVVSSSGGGDGTADLSWAYDLQIENAVSNLEHEGLTINLYMDGDDVVGSTATDAGSVGTANTVFRISVDSATGVVTLSQYMEIDHALPGDTAAPYDDQLAILGDNLVNLVGTATITDNDGDQASEEVSLDLGGNIRFADDGPSLTDVVVGSSVMLDETDAGSPGGFPITVDSAAPILSFGSDYGADDGGTTTFEIAVVGGGASGLSTAQGDYPITLVQTSPTLITGTYNGGLTAFTIQINADGTLTLTQQVPLEHTDPTDDNDVLDLAGLIDATVTVTDDDGDSVSDMVAIGGAISFYDDGPSVSGNLAARLDEDDLPGGIDGGTGDQDAQNLSGILGHDYGGDGAGSIAFLTTGAPTGFQYVASGDDLLIQQDQGGSWVTVVTVTLDPVSGAYSFSQNNPILHADGSNENNQNFSIGYQVTDADGDTATGNLTLVVDDDTPVADGSAALTGSVDEDGLDDGVPGGGNDIAGEALSDSGSVTGMFSPGADGPLTYSLDTDTSVLDALNLSSGSTPLTYAVVGDTLTAYAGATEVFTFELTSGGTWTFTLKAPLDHADDGANDDNATDIAIDFGSLIVGTDADNDAVNATGSLIVTIDDDSPDAVDDANAIGEDGTTVGGNVLLGNDGTDGTADDDRFGGDGPGDPKIVSVVGDNGSGGIDDVVDGTYGTLEIGNDGSYTYTLDPSTVQDLDDGDEVYDTFTYTIVDADGDESTAQVVITINGANDAPVLAADTNWIQDVDGAVPDPTTTGNVLQDVDHTRPAGGDYADVADTDVDAGDVLQVTDLTGTGPGSGINTAVGGTYGSLQIDADGNYTYTLDADNATVDALNVGDAPLTDTFTYTVSDGTVTDTQTVTIYIYGTNAAPVVTGDAVAVSEEGLPDGNADDDPIVPADADTTDSKTASGSIGITDIDDSSFTVTLGEPLQTLNAADGTPLTWDVSADGKTLKGYSTDIGNPEITVVIADDGTYQVTLGGPIEHGDDTVEDTTFFVVPVSVSDGSTTTNLANGITVTIEDDSPEVSGNLAARLDEDDLPGGIDGGTGDQDAQNLSGILGHDYGGDGAGSIAFLTTGAPTGFQYVASGDDLLIQQDQGGSWVTVVTVTLDPVSGAYSFSQNNPILHADGSNENNQNFSIGYQVTDADGDTATGNLTLVVDDDTPVADGSAALTGSVDEDGLDDGVPGGGNDIAGEALSDSGSVTGMFSPGADGPLTYSLDTDTSVLDALNLSSGSTPLTYAVVGDTLTAYAGATEVFTFELTSGGTWTFTLKAPLDHADDGANDDNATDIAIDFGSLIVGTDADNDAVNATGSLIVTIDDDSPDAVDDANAIGEDGTTVGGNVLLGNDGTDGTADDDRFGGDGPGDPKIVSVVGDNGSGGIDDVVDGTYGTLEIGNDGSYTYTLDPSTVQDLDDGDEVYDTFTYTIVDADGDESTAQVVITINGANDAPVLAADTNWIQDVDGAVPDPTTTGNVLQDVDHTRPAGGDYADVADTDVDAGDVLQVTDLTGTGPGSGINTAVGGTYGSLQIDADGNYTYTLDADNATVDALNVGDAPLTDTFTYTVSDGTVTDTQTVTIYIYGTNAAPVVTGDAVAVSEEGLPDGNADDDPIVPADADTTDSKTASGSIGITDIDDSSFTVTLGEPLQTLNAADGTPLTWDVSADGKTLKGYSTDIGNPEITVVIADDGTYQVTLGGPIEHGDDTVEDTTFFVVPVSVSDGSTTTNLANGITVTIEDDSPEVSGNLAARLDEDDLPGGIDGGTGDQDAQNLSGILGHDYGGDGAGSIAFLTTGAPTGFQYVASGDDLLIQQDQGGSWVTVVTVTLDPVSGAYSFSQNNPILHADGSNENNQNFSIGYQVTDADGDTATGNLTLVVDDDTPVANPDTDTVSEGGSTSGNVVTDAEANGDNGADDAGADGFAASPTGIVTGIASVNQGTSDTTVNGSENYVLDGEFGTLTLNRDGTYTYESDPNSISTTEYDVFEYTVIDADGDTSTTTLTIEVTPVALVGDDESVTVYEEAMDTTEDAGDVAASTVTGTSPGDTTESASGTVTVAGTGVEYSISGGSVSGNLTTVVGTYGTLVLNNDTGAFTYTLTSAYSHTPGVDDGVTTQPNAEQFTYTATDDDGNTTTGTISVNIVDDVPLPLVTEKAVISNGAGLPASFDLDSDGNVDDNTGADQDGTVRFLSSLEGETGLSSNGSPIYYYLSDDGQTLIASTSATDPFPLGAPPDTSDWVFRVDINQDLDVSASTDQYTVQMYDKVDSIGQVEFTDGTYDFVGGNTHWVGYVPLNQKTTPVDDDSSDLLITPIVDGDTANGNANEIGSGGAGGGSLGVGPNQGLRLDFVVDLTGNPTSGGGGYVSPSNHTFDRHYTVPSAAIEFSVGSGPNKLGSIQFIAYDDPDYVGANTPDADDTVGDVVTWDNINQVIITYGGSTASTADDAEYVIDTSAPGSYDIVVSYGGTDYTLHKSADGSVTYDGIKTGTVVAVFTSDGSYTTLETHYVDGDEFTITGIGSSVITNSPVEIALPIELVDSDGDVTPSYIDLTFEPSDGTQDFSNSGSPVNATATTDDPNLIGSDFNDTLTGNSASNWIAGGLGQDTLTGGAGKDYFVIDPSHLTAAADDIITDYAAGDLIDLRALISSLGSDAANATVRLFGNSLQVDPDGAGSDFGWLPVATLSNNPTSVDVLLEYGESAVTLARIAPPVVLDLDGDGAEFVGLEAGIGYDYNGDGVAEGTAWVGADDAILAYDANGDGTVSNAGEFVFGTDGSSDLEAIAAQFDDNGDGVLDANDAAYAAFGIWQDANQNGVTDEGEFTSLEDAGISSISLTSDGHAYSAANDDVSVSGSSVFTWSNGSTGTVADAGFLTGEQRTSQRTTEYAVSAAAIGGFFTYAMPGDHLPAKMFDFGHSRSADDFRVGLETHSSSPSSHYEAIPSAAFAPAASEAASLAAPQDSSGHGPDGGDHASAGLPDAGQSTQALPLEAAAWDSGVDTASHGGGSGSPDQVMDALLTMQLATTGGSQGEGDEGAADAITPQDLPEVAAVIDDVMAGQQVDQIIDAVAPEAGPGDAAGLATLGTQVDFHAMISGDAFAFAGMDPMTMVDDHAAAAPAA